MIMISEFKIDFIVCKHNRKLGVFDEAHNIEQIIMQFTELKINYNILEKQIGHKLSDKIKKSIGYTIWTTELNKILPKYKKAIQTLHDEISMEKKPEKKLELTKRKKSFKNSIMKMERIIHELEHNHKNWIIKHDKNEYNELYNVIFKPIYVKDFVKQDLFSETKHNLLMSATILDYELVANWLGLDSDEVYFIKHKSPFKKENRPIFLDFAGKMTFKHKYESLPLALPILKQIFEKHKDQKGLIHTNSYEFTEFITTNFNYRTVSHDNGNREEVLSKFEDSDYPLILVSPSMTEGINLPYDKCEFQVILKIPFPNLADPQVRTRMKREPKWYDYKTILTIVQAYGRGMRNKDDHCTTYVLDESFNDVIRKDNKNSFFSEFFKEAIINQ